MSTGVILARLNMKLQKEIDELKVALNDAINRPMGVVPDSAMKFYCGKTGKVK